MAGSYPRNGGPGNPGAPGSAGNPGDPSDPNSGRMGNMGPYQGAGARTDVGPPDDLLRVYTLTPEGKLVGPLWSREMKDGLDGPDVLLLRDLRDAVERAYPPQAAGQPATPAKP